jgi:hypothetical protein
VVLNGDTFELDGASAWEGLAGGPPADVGRPEAEAAALERILQDHEGFVRALGRLLASGARLVFVSGNHDQGLGWPAVQKTLKKHLVAAARRAGNEAVQGEAVRGEALRGAAVRGAAVRGEADEGVEAETAVTDRIVFRRWFHRSNDGLYVEHGQQYDADSAVGDPLVPVRGDGAGLQLSLGSAGLRHILGGIGTMNPHNPRSFRLGGPGAYLRHWLRHYVGQGRSLLRTWIFGALRCALHVLGQRRAGVEAGAAARLDALSRQARAAGLRPGAVRRLRALQRRPVSDRPYAVLRQLWLDRLGLVTLGLLSAAVAGLLGGWVYALVALALFATAFMVYEHVAPGVDGDDYDQALPWTARRVAAITGDTLVVLGHSHRPARRLLPGGATYVNTGAWAPSYADPECTRPVDSDRTFAWVRSDGEQIRVVRLLAWQGGRLVSFDDAPAPLLPERPRRRPAAPRDRAQPVLRGV